LKCKPDRHQEATHQCHADFAALSFDALSFDALSFDALSFDALSFDALSFDALSSSALTSSKLSGSIQDRRIDLDRVPVHRYQGVGIRDGRWSGQRGTVTEEWRGDQSEEVS
jgi:hypothetical protein